MMRDILREIESIRSTARLMLLAQRAAVLAAWVIGAALLLVGADYIFRLPGAARLGLEILLLIGLLAALWRYVSPAVRFRPTLTEMALRFEKVLPGLRGHLASGVDFILDSETSQSPLAAQAVAEAQQRVGRENLRALVTPKRTFNDIGVFALAAALVATLCITMPGSASIAAQRWLNPFGEARWLKRTGVESAMGNTVYPLGKALPLRARVTRGLSDGMRVTAHYRLIRDGNAQPWDQVVLTRQNDDLFERLIEPDADTIEITFATQDDETPVESIRLVPAPRIEQAELLITPPAYAAKVLTDTSVDLGPGTDERAVLTPPALAGSRASLTLVFNKPLPTDLRGDEWKPRLNWHVDAPDGAAATDDATLTATMDDQGQASAWTIKWTLGGTTRLRPMPVDEYGLLGPDDVAYRIESRIDAAPTVTIIDPATDRTVLPQAYVPLKAEARDDVLVNTLAVHATINEEPARVIATHEGATTLEQLTDTLDLSLLEVKPGDTVTIIATAVDTFALDGATHEAAESSPRRLRVITDAEFVEQVYQNLSAVRDSAIRIEQEQRDLRERLEKGQARPGDLRDQSRVGQQIDRQREALSRIADRVRDNRLGNRDIDELMGESSDLLDAAGQESNKASEALSEAQQNPPDTEQKAKELQEQRDAAQQQVSEQLSSLIELLDRGQDSWVMRRQVEQLLNDQKNLEEQARQTTDRTRGQDLAQLTEQNQRALEDLARQQEELAQRGQQLVDDLRHRADQMRKSDPDLSNAMDEAARQAQQKQLEQKMSDAAQQLQQNQGQKASDQQQQAMEALQSMLDQLEATDKAKAERLARQVESLLQSLEALIATQETQLGNLLAAEGQYAGLDMAMLQLSTNTYAVLDMAVEGGRDMAAIAQLIEKAAKAQETSIVALRAASIDPTGVQGSEEESLSRLKEARELAAKLQEQLQQQEQARKKAELIQAYRDLHERQAALQAETQPLAGAAMDRRQRVMARQLGNQQAQIRVDAMDLLQKTEDLADAFVFQAGHQQIDTLAGQVVEDLRAATIGPMQLMREQDIAERFLALATALQDSQSDQEFEEPGDANSGGGGGGGGGPPPPLVPPMAQLKLLRALQESVYRSTRLLDESGAALDEAARSARLDDLGASQKQLTDLAQQLIEMMQQQQEGGRALGPDPKGPQP